MPTVGEQLRAARESLHLSVHQVADTTKIRTDHIRALEEGNYDMFVAPVYIRGFTRTYASLLKLDVATLLGELDQELAQTEKFQETPSLLGREKTFLDVLMLQLSRINLRTLLALLVILLLFAATIGAFLAWSRHASGDSTEGIEEGVYHSRNPNSGETLPVPAPNHQP